MATLTERSMAYIKSMNHFNKNYNKAALSDRSQDENTKRTIKSLGDHLYDDDVEKIFNALITGDTELLR
ncbi:MAG: hypothetical protein VZR73_17265 [Acutalibacteraceae bacterium]|nr:hypothetical protein [Acutalibacteraceae bacterium]